MRRSLTLLALCLPAGSAFANLNTPDQLDAVRRIIERRTSPQ